MSATLPVLLIEIGVLALAATLIRSMWRMDEEPRRRHPDRSEGGGSFGVTTLWGAGVARASDRRAGDRCGRAMPPSVSSTWRARSGSSMSAVR